MAYTTINDPSKHFQITTHTGNGASTQAITNGGNSDMQPDLIWTKQRTDAVGHNWTDSTRGASKALFSEGDDAEDTGGNINSFDSDGFTTTDANRTNQNTKEYISWQWKANGGSRTTFNESGSNPGGGYQANTTAGFSIVDYTGTGSNGTVSHGLGKIPGWMVIKARTEPTGGTHFGSDQGNWVVYHHDIATDPATDALFLNLNSDRVDSAGAFNDTDPTTSVFTIGNNVDVNEDADTYIAYVWNEVQGFSKFGQYIGNGNANGPFVYTGFTPAFLMIKRLATDDFFIVDNVRDPVNPRGIKFLYANQNAAEVTSDKDLDIYSNGFKCRAVTGFHNDPGNTYIYMAFAKHPFVTSTGVPCPAHA
tara:strand:+ start:2069 stop:3160 length:1092 start_codon:yes stop_codon:yes gene_type:complete